VDQDADRVLPQSKEKDCEARPAEPPSKKVALQETSVAHDEMLLRSLDTEDRGQLCLLWMRIDVIEHKASYLLSSTVSLFRFTPDDNQ
jgi:hypothetical protein